MLRGVSYFCLLILAADALENPCAISRDETDPPLPSPPPIKMNDKTYIIETSFLASWYKAEQVCRLHGMNLASINNQAENDALGRTIESYGLNKLLFWTSGNDLDDSFSFVWQSTGSSFSFTSWRPNEPDHAVFDNETEHCVEVDNYITPGGWWNDCICSSQLYFICEF